MQRNELIRLENELKSEGLLEDHRLINMLESYKKRAKTKYGLVWEEHSEDVVEALKTGLTKVSEYKDKRFIKDHDKPQNLLIEGDNLHGLMLLKNENIKVDVIYIDPPYNTHSEGFMYNDKIIDKDDGYSHSKWLSFMNERLELARDLLSKDGCIFISIDDNEQSNLKLLMDKIFGENNFINNISVNMSNMSGPKIQHAINGRRFPKTKESILLYSKNKDEMKLDIPKHEKSEWDDEYNLIIPDLDYETFKNRDNMEIKDLNNIYKNYELCSLNTYMKEKNIEDEDNSWKLENSDKIFASKPNTAILKAAKKGKYTSGLSFLKNKEGSNKLIRTDFNRETRTARIELVNAKENAEVFYGDNWIDIATTGGIAKEGGVDFPNGKKPLKLVKRIINTYLKKDAVVLDFFAGSGTTGHAVMELNKEDGGDRQFILMTNNEISTKDVFKLALKNKEMRKKLSDNKISLTSYTGKGMREKNKERAKDIESFFLRDEGLQFCNSDIVQDQGICRSKTYKRMNNVIEGYGSNYTNVLPNNLSYYKLTIEKEFNFKDEHLSRRDTSLLGLIVKYKVLPTKINEFTYVFDLGKKQAVIYEADIYIKDKVINKIKNQFTDYTFKVISEFNNSDSKLKALREEA